MNKIFKSVITMVTIFIVAMPFATMNCRAEEINNSIYLTSVSTYVGEEFNVNLEVKANNSCIAYDVLLRYDAQLELVNVEGSQASCVFVDKNGDKCVSLVGYSSSSFEDGKVVTLTFIAPQTIQNNYEAFRVEFKEIHDFCGEEENFKDFGYTNSLVYIAANKDFKILVDNKQESIVRYRGDIDNNNKLNIRDAAMISRLCSIDEINSVSETESFFADVNEDGKVNVRDAAAIARYLASPNKEWN